MRRYARKVCCLDPKRFAAPCFKGQFFSVYPFIAKRVKSIPLTLLRFPQCQMATDELFVTREKES
jgi:hypothetical protein